MPQSHLSPVSSTCSLHFEWLRPHLESKRLGSEAPAPRADERGAEGQVCAGDEDQAAVATVVQ